MKKFWQRWKYYIFATLLVLLLATLLRVVMLTSLPVFADEAIYIRWAQIMANEPTLRFLPLSDGKQPLFMWGLMLIVHKLHDPLFAGRIISVFAGLGTMIGIGAISLSLYKSKLASVISMLIWALSPFAVFFNRMALVDATLAFFAVWSAFFTILTVQTRRLDMAMITGFLLGGGLLTKSPALFFVLLMPISLLFVSFQKKEKKTFAILHILGLFFVAVFIGYGLYNILRLGPNFHLISSRNLDYVYPVSHLLEKPLDPLLPYLDRAREWIWLMGPSSLYLLAGLSIFLGIKKHTKVIVFLLVWALIPVLINAEFAKVFTARYILYSVPFLIALASGAFTQFSKHKKIVVLSVVIFVIQSLYSNYLFIFKPAEAYFPQSERGGYLEEWTAGDGIKEIAEYLKNEHEENPHQQIVVGTEGYFGTLPDGLQMYMEGVPNVVVKGVGLHLIELPNDLRESKIAGNKTYLVINKSRLIANHQEIKLKKIAEFPKAFRTPGTHDFVQYGPQEVLYFFEVEQ